MEERRSGILMYIKRAAMAEGEPARLNPAATGTDNTVTIGPCANGGESSPAPPGFGGCLRLSKQSWRLQHTKENSWQG